MELRCQIRQRTLATERQDTRSSGRAPPCGEQISVAEVASLGYRLQIQYFVNQPTTLYYVVMNFSVIAVRLAVVFFVLPSAFYLSAESCMAQSPASHEPVVKQIDHILIVSPSAKELFALLSKTFQLPVAWPMTDYGAFTCGGVSLGNVNLEIILEQTPDESRDARWSGFALEPLPLQKSLAELDARGIRHGVPAPFREFQSDGSLKTLWTTVGLPEVSYDSTQIFLCEYDDGITMRRQRLAEELRSRNGGPLSIRAAKQIVYGTRDVKDARR